MPNSIDYDEEKAIAYGTSPTSCDASPISSYGFEKPVITKSSETVTEPTSESKPKASWILSLLSFLWFPRLWNTSTPTVTRIDTECRKLEDCPSGYPRFGAFLSSDSNFMVYRGFSYAHARILLGLQDEVVRLERELDDIDRAHDNDEDRIRLQCKENDDIMAEDEPGVRTRQIILAELKDKVLAYDEVLIKARELASFQRPSDRDYRSVRTWLQNVDTLVDEEQEYIKYKEDMVTLRQGRECAGFDGWIEHALQRVHHKLQESIHCSVVKKLFCSKELRRKTSDKNIYYFSENRVDKLVGLIITVVIFALLVLPVVVMYHFASYGDRNDTIKAIGVLIVFTLLFSAAMAALTRAKRHELFAASAAYCAVLVVFISNFSNISSSEPIAAG